MIKYVQPIIQEVTMFDNLRDDPNTYKEAGDLNYGPAARTGSGYSSSRRSRRFLGMTSFQRFAIAFMLMLAVCVLGTMCLLVTGKIGF